MYAIRSYYGAAIGTLVDEGKLNWDTPVITDLPDFTLKDSYVGNHSNLRDMLAHRTGLRRDGELLGRVGYSNDEILYRMRYLESDAGFRERYLYSRITSYNVCYTKLLRSLACHPIPAPLVPSCRRSRARIPRARQRRDRDD